MTDCSSTSDDTIVASQRAGGNYPYTIDVSARTTSQWLANTPFPAAALVRPSDGNGTGFAYQASGAGETGENEPAWPTTAGQTVVDGSITWTADVPPAAGQDTISSVTWVQSNPPDATLTLGSQSHNSFAVTGYVGGGTSGKVYTIVITITMSSGAIYPAQLVLTIL